MIPTPIIVGVKMQPIPPEGVAVLEAPPLPPPFPDCLVRIVGTAQDFFPADTGDNTAVGGFQGTVLAMTSDGTYLVVGYPNLGTNYPKNGSAFVFKKVGATYTQVAELLPNGGDPYSAWGSFVSISDDLTIVVWDDFEAHFDVFASAGGDTWAPAVRYAIATGINDCGGMINRDGTAIVSLDYNSGPGPIASAHIYSGSGSSWALVQTFDITTAVDGDSADVAKVAMTPDGKIIALNIGENSTWLVVLVSADGASAWTEAQRMQIGVGEGNSILHPDAEHFFRDGTYITPDGSLIAYGVASIVPIGLDKSDFANRRAAIFILTGKPGSYAVAARILGVDGTDDFSTNLCVSDDADYLLAGSGFHAGAGGRIFAMNCLREKSGYVYVVDSPDAVQLAPEISDAGDQWGYGVAMNACGDIIVGHREDVSIAGVKQGRNLVRAFRTTAI